MYVCKEGTSKGMHVMCVHMKVHKFKKMYA